MKIEITEPVSLKAEGTAQEIAEFVAALSPRVEHSGGIPEPISSQAQLNNYGDDSWALASLNANASIFKQAVRINNEGRKIEAIKYLRGTFPGLGLRCGKDLLDFLAG